MQFLTNRLLPFSICACALFCYIISLISVVHAADTVDEYIRALQPPMLTRGFGVTATTSTTGKSPEVSIPLQFAKNSADVLPGARGKLSQLAQALDDPTLRQYKFTIEGHTCNLGSNSLNMDLSKRRAYSVAYFLTNNSSLSPSQFAVQWYGEDQPAEANVNEAARRRNRRVVIKNTLKIVEVPLNGHRAELEIYKHVDEEKHLVKNGDRLESSAKYSIAFKSASESFVYVCQMDETGKAALLFPNQNNPSMPGNPVTSNTSYHILESGQLFFLEDVTGTEQFVLLTHQQPV